MKIIVLLIHLLFIRCFLSDSREGKCIRSLSNGETEWYCCDNKEDKNGVCFDCLDGFLSEEGEPCHSCPRGTYGRKCGDTCNCQILRCDNIQGCLNNSDYKTVSMMSSDSITNWENSDSRTTSKPDIWILHTELIYVICTSVLTFAFLMCMLWFRHLVKKRRNRDTQGHVVSYRNKVSKKANQADNTSTTPKKYGVYDYIDDSQIQDIVKPIVLSLETAQTENQNSSDPEFDSDDSDDTTTPLNDGYLNPYQPVVSSSDTQGYSSPANSSHCELHGHLDIHVPSTVVLGIDNTTTSQKIELSSYNSYNDAMSAQPNMNQQLS